MRKEFRDLAEPETAREAIRDLDLGGGTESVPLTAARGRVLAERIDAAIDVPGFDRAAVDGYAVRSTDTVGADEGDPVLLSVGGTVHAGERPEASVDDGVAVEVATGAVVPPGADAVVMVEDTTETDETDGCVETEEGVEVRTAVAPGDGIMVAGADVAAGERGLGPGTHISAREVALLSALGIESVPVRAQPTVGIVSTGEELVRPGDDLDSDAGQIHDVNSYAIAAAVEAAGGEPEIYPHVGDDEAAMERVLREAAAECDLVCSSGSTSAGALDVLYRVIEEQGELLLHGVAVKPGKPMLVGMIGDSAYVGLPGYPVSAMSIFRTFVAPAIRSAAGLPTRERVTVDGRLAEGVRYREGRLRLLPVGLVEDGDGETLVYPVDKGSGATTSLVEADGVVEMPPDVEQLVAGRDVTVELFSPETRPPTLLGMGEDDPLLSRLLDDLDRPRYLAVGSREGLRRLRDGLPDVAVVAGPTRRDVEAEDVGGWTREWGLVVPEDNPTAVEGVADLVDRDLSFVNRERTSGLRASLEARLDDLATDRDRSRADLTDSIRGWTLTAQAHESPPRRVLAGDADVALGLRATAEKLGLGFVSVGEQAVRLRVQPERREKPGVRALVELLPPADDRLAALAGYGSLETE